MIRLADIAEAIRYADAQIEELDGLEAWAEHHRVEVDGLVYVAGQRALRAGYARDGMDPRKLSRADYEVIRLSPASMNELPLLGATWMDGFAAGLMAKERHP